MALKSIRRTSFLSLSVVVLVMRIGCDFAQERRLMRWE